MSTKIYNGYLLDDMNVIELQKFLINFSDLIEVERKKLYYTHLVRIATEIIDKTKYGIHFGHKQYIKNDTIEPYWTAYRHVEEAVREIKMKGLRNPSCDFDCQVSIIPIENKILALLYTERQEFTQIWENLEQVSEYGYWNNVDPLESVTDEQWDRRKIDWDLAMPSGVPAKTCLSFDPFVLLPEYNIQESLKYVLDKNARARKIADELMWKNFVDNSPKLNSVSSYFTYKDTVKEDGSNYQQFLHETSRIEAELDDIDRDILTNNLIVPESLILQNEKN